MAKVMSFADDFYTGGLETHDFVARSDRPTSVIQALASMLGEPWAELCREWGHDPETAEPWELLADLRDAGVMSCDGHEGPITVYFDAAGDISVTIYED